MTAAESYLASLRDGRRVYFADRLVPDVTAELAFAAELASAVRGCEANAGDSGFIPAYVAPPCSVDELRSMELTLRHCDATANGTVLAVLTALTATGGATASAETSVRARSWVNAVARRDARVAVATCELGTVEGRDDCDGARDPVRVVGAHGDGLTLAGTARA